MDHTKIPGYPDFDAATPDSVASIRLLGAGFVSGNVNFTRDQHRALTRFYGVDEQQFRAEVSAARENHARLVAAARDVWDATPPNYGGRRLKDGKELKDPSTISEPDYAGLERLLRAGAYRNVYRAVERDGLRLMAVLARFLESGEDPVKLVLTLLHDAGYDVTDIGWLDLDDDLDDEE